MSTSDDDKPICDVATPDFSAQVAHLPKSLPPKRGRGRPRKNPVSPPAAAAARLPSPEPEPVAKPPTPPPCPHQSAVPTSRSPPLSVDSDDESGDEPLGVACGTFNESINQFLEELDNNNRILLEENAKLRAQLAQKEIVFEDPDLSWDQYLVGMSSGLALGVLLRKLSAMLF